MRREVSLCAVSAVIVTSEQKDMKIAHRTVSAVFPSTPPSCQQYTFYFWFNFKNSMQTQS